VAVSLSKSFMVYLLFGMLIFANLSTVKLKHLQGVSTKNYTFPLAGLGKLSLDLNHKQNNTAETSAFGKPSLNLWYMLNQCSFVCRVQDVLRKGRLKLCRSQLLLLPMHLPVVGFSSCIFSLVI